MLKEVLDLPTDDPSVILRELATGRDDDALHNAAVENPEYSNNYGNTLYDCFNTLEKTEAKRLAAVGALRMGIWKDAEFVGFVSATPDEKRAQAEIGYFIRDSYKGNGYATLATKALTAYVVPKFPRVYAEVHTEHGASARVLEKAGYAKVGEEQKKWGPAAIYEPAHHPRA